MNNDEMRDKIKGIIGMTCQEIFEQTGLMVGRVTVDISEPPDFPPFEFDVEEDG